MQYDVVIISLNIMIIRFKINLTMNYTKDDMLITMYQTSTYSIYDCM